MDDDSGTDWANLLGFVQDLRAARGAAFDEYYYGLIMPNETYDSYCRDSCTTGRSFVVDSPDNASMRASVGVGYPTWRSAETMVHEIGHAHGREHAPCDVGDADPRYPHAGGLIGTWGLDTVFSGVKDPSLFADFMSYCEPEWVSDYTYGGCYMRAMSVASGGDVWYPPDHVTRPWASVAVVYPDSLLRGPTLDDPAAGLGGEAWNVVLLDAGGVVLGVAEGRFHRYGAGDGGVIVYPEPGDEVAAVHVPGVGTLTLTSP